MLTDFLSLLRGGRAARPVWTADISYWLAGQRQAGTHDPAWDTEEGCLALHQQLGVMPYYLYEKFNAFEPRFDATVEARTETRGNTTRRSLVTRVGTLSEESVYLPESSCTACARHFVQTPADLRVLRFVLEHRRLEPAGHLREYRQRRELWERYDGLPPLGMPRSPLSSLCYEWAGVENTAFLLADCRGEVEAAMALMAEQEAPVLDALCELAPPLVHFPDNLASDSLGGWYPTYLAPGHRRRIARLHAAGVKVAVHLDGAVRGLLPQLPPVGFDAVEALTPAPGGDAELSELRSLAGDERVILWGGVPGILFAPPFTWAQMQAHVERLLEVWAGQRFVIGVADQVPPDGDIRFCRQIADLLAQRV